MRGSRQTSTRRGNAFVSRCSLLCLSIAFIVSSARLVSGQRWPVAQDATLRRITVSNDDGDVYVESSGDGSEIVLKTEKVRITDGDLYCGTSNVGLSAQIDALKTKDDAIDERIDALNDTQIELRNDLDTLETSTSGRLSSIDTTLTSLTSTDTSLADTDASLSSRIDTLNATDAQLKATDETLATRITSLNATDTVLKGVDDDLSSRIDALRDIYVNELNVTDKQLIVTDATLGSRIDDLNATQNELKSADAALSSRIATLESAHTEYERIDDEVASLIDALNATDATMQLQDASLSDRIDALNATNQALSSTDAILASQIASLMPPKCTSPGGTRLHYDGENWTCTCESGWSGTTCETSDAINLTTALPYSPWCHPKVAHMSELNVLMVVGGYECPVLGQGSSDGKSSAHAAMFNLTSRKWKTVSSMPVGRSGVGIVARGTKVYVFGGVVTNSDGQTTAMTTACHVYDAETDSWDEFTSLPVARTGLGCSLPPASSVVVCAGGYNDIHGGSYSTFFKGEAWQIDLSAASSSWTSLPSLSTRRFRFQMASDEFGRYYVPGGYSVTTNLKSVEVLELGGSYTGTATPASWNDLSPEMPTSRMTSSSVFASGSLYVFGGINGGIGSRTWATTYFHYDTSTGLWREVDHTSLIDLSIGERADSGCRLHGHGCGDAIWYTPGVGVSVFMPVNNSAVILRTIITL